MPRAHRPYAHLAHVAAPSAVARVEVDALLQFLHAPPGEREQMTRALAQELASAGLDEATLHELLDRGRPAERDGPPDLRRELAAARARVIERARVLLGVRAAAATIGRAM